MKLEHIEQVAVFYEPAPARRKRVGRLARKQRQILFEYDAAFLGATLELSPFRLRLTPGVVVGQPDVFEGLMGVFEDSLPDGWGRLLIDRRAAELGISGGSLTPLDRLTVVGSRSMGALIYEPEIELDDPAVVRLSELAKDVDKVMRNAESADLERLIAVGGSPKGARPKVLIQLAPDGDVRFGAKDIQPGFTAWLVKFPAREDDPHSAPLEHAYFLMAKAAGLDVPRTQLLGKTKRGPGYFAIERFDRDGTTRIHTHTLGGLLHLPYGYAALDYRDLLKVTRELTRNEAAVAEMFRRASIRPSTRARPAADRVVAQAARAATSADERRADADPGSGDRRRAGRAASATQRRGARAGQCVAELGRWGHRRRSEPEPLAAVNGSNLVDVHRASLREALG